MQAGRGNYFIGFFFLVCFLFYLLHAFFDVLLDELFVLLGVGLGHLVEHFPDVVGHAEVFLVFEAEHLLELLGEHIVIKVH